MLRPEPAGQEKKASTTTWRKFPPGLCGKRQKGVCKKSRKAQEIFTSNTA
jgi:hypothetical protein